MFYFIFSDRSFFIVVDYSTGTLCRVHVFNVEELILCALPHHDAHAFVRIVQLLELG